MFLLAYLMFISLDNHLDFPEYILIEVSYRFIHNVEIPLKIGWSIFQTWLKIAGKKMVGSFWIKIKIRGDMSSRLLEYFSV